MSPKTIFPAAVPVLLMLRVVSARNYVSMTLTNDQYASFSTVISTASSAASSFAKAMDNYESQSGYESLKSIMDTEHAAYTTTALDQLSSSAWGFDALPTDNVDYWGVVKPVRSYIDGLEEAVGEVLDRHKELRDTPQTTFAQNALEYAGSIMYDDVQKVTKFGEDLVSKVTDCSILSSMMEDWDDLMTSYYKVFSSFNYNAGSFSPSTVVCDGYTIFAGINGQVPSSSSSSRSSSTVSSTASSSSDSSSDSSSSSDSGSRSSSGSSSSTSSRTTSSSSTISSSGSASSRTTQASSSSSAAATSSNEANANIPAAGLFIAGVGAIVGYLV